MLSLIIRLVNSTERSKDMNKADIVFRALKYLGFAAAGYGVYDLASRALDQGYGFGLVGSYNINTKVITASANVNRTNKSFDKNEPEKEPELENELKRQDDGSGGSELSNEKLFGSQDNLSV